MLRKRSSTEVERQELDSQVLSTEDKENMFRPTEENPGWKSVQNRQEKRRSGGLLMMDIVPNSPLKRTEMAMNVDEADLASPSSKRRSLHASTTLDFSIFDQESLQSSFDDKRSQDDSDWFQSSSPLSQSRFSTIPKRSISLRKSTLQQRYPERSNFPKTSPTSDLNPHWPEMSPTSGSKKGGRISLDNHFQPLPRDSPFSAEGKLISASIHPVTFNQPPMNMMTQRHPLSRTLTQSSSTPSSVQDDSPTHEPIHRTDRPKSHDFAKSLPVGALRPREPESQPSNEYCSQESFATPAAYKSARPLPAAFMSTGLISKKNRNAEEPDAGLPKAHMPDTPCKKQSVMFDTAERPRPNPAFKSRHVSDTPTTPADVTFGFARANPLPWAKNTSIFGIRASKPSLIRKASLASIEAEEKPTFHSPPNQGNSQSTEADYPPTPTKHAGLESLMSAPASPSPRHRPSQTLAQSYPGSSQAARPSSSKLSPIQASPESMESDTLSGADESPSASLRSKSVLRITSKRPLSFAKHRNLKLLKPPHVLVGKPYAAQHAPSLLSAPAKSSPTPDSPHLEFIDRFSPHTPSEHFAPPDPSGLSISGRGDKINARPVSSHFPIVPATPTGPREYFGNFSNRPSLNLNAPDITDVDQSLTSRFEKVDLVGTGEFSQVYRVTKSPDASPFSKTFGMASSKSAGLPERVWAVKKSRYPYSGPKDRQRKVHEVDVLKAMGHSDHILQFVESWENHGHLYIQTEFCEEGTLDVFLAQNGRKARLDDFRIWKILLELTMGLNHIHNHGFIHLDLKPANILITFEGVLKIGDFGMAARWPAKPGIEGEGDREYIGPEVLKGQYDKPADIFALGLIILETAGNVELPDNGTPWQKLRSGDMSDVPSLTWSSDDSNILRDASGNPLLLEEDDMQSLDKSTSALRSGELLNAPEFMVDASHEQALDAIVRWMIAPEPFNRPVATQVLETRGVRFVDHRRRAGATIFEGNWGPADEILVEDAEMMDV